MTDYRDPNYRDPIRPEYRDPNLSTDAQPWSTMTWGWIAGIASATLLSWGYGRFIAPSLTHQDRIVRALIDRG